MGAIAGIFAPQSGEVVKRMLKRMAHRACGEIRVQEPAEATMGVIGTERSSFATDSGQVEDRSSEHHYALAGLVNGHPLLERDALGVVPLYYGRREDGALCFASEVKGLIEATRDIRELPAGCCYNGEIFERYFGLTEHEHLTEASDVIAAKLRTCMENAVRKRIRSDEIGCFLSGGLDSSVMAALARPYVKKLRTVVAGVQDAPDLDHAREVADYIKSDHHEVIVTLDEMLSVLPDVIWHLESFDALLVRSSIMHYFASQCLSRHSAEAFSGEGGDELFAGYAYLKNLPRTRLAAELIEITNRLHNTALQRVDRCAAAFGLRTHVCFLDPDVVDLAMSIPIDLKLHGAVEKWIVRKAAENILPPQVLNRPKAKFWEGAGVQNLLAEYAESSVSDAEFASGRTLPNGWVLGDKEEFMYYRIFRERFGLLANLDWMGRTPSS